MSDLTALIIFVILNVNSVSTVLDGIKVKFNVLYG